MGLPGQAFGHGARFAKRKVGKGPALTPAGNAVTSFRSRIRQNSGLKSGDISYSRVFFPCEN